MNQQNDFNLRPGKRCAGCGNAVPLCACRSKANANSNHSTPSADFGSTVITGQPSSNLISHQIYPATIVGTHGGSQSSVIGSILSERYELIAKLGTGGMGVVYKARHLALNKLFAIKIVTEHLASQDDFRIRFDREAKAASLLDHPNLVSITDYGTTEFNEPYIVMDFINGRNLAEDLTNFQRLPADRAIRIFMQICDGVGYAHDIGIVHRDLKPGNVMLIRAGEQNEQVKIIDFGIAKMLSGQPEVTQSNTRTSAMGSPLYMSPEQCSGRRADRRSDIYSMGCLMYECISSTPPFQGENILSTMAKHINDAPKAFNRNLQIPHTLEAVIMRCLEKNPAERFQAMAELKSALSRCSAFGSARETELHKLESKFESKLQSQSQFNSKIQLQSDSEPSSKFKSKSAKTRTIVTVTSITLLATSGALGYFLTHQRYLGNSNTKQPAPSRTVPLAAIATKKPEEGKLPNSKLSEEEKQKLFQEQLRLLDATPLAESDQNKTVAELNVLCKSSLEAGNEKKAIGYFKLAVKKDPVYLDSYDTLFHYFWAKSEQNVAANNQSIIVTNTCLLYHPNDYDYYTNRAMCYRNLGEFRKALDDLGRALSNAVRPEQKAQAHLHRAHIHQQMHDTDAAIAEYKGNATVRDLNCLCLLADCYAAKDDSQNAIKTATEALATTSKDIPDPSQLNSTLFWARKIRGSAYKRLGKHAQAKNDFEAALVLSKTEEEKAMCVKEIAECGKSAAGDKD